MPVGGIATGNCTCAATARSACGRYSTSTIFSGYGRDNYRTYRPDSPVDSGFAVVLESGESSKPSCGR